MTVGHCIYRIDRIRDGQPYRGNGSDARYALPAPLVSPSEPDLPARLIFSVWRMSPRALKVAEVLIVPARSVIAGFVLVLVGAAAGVATHAYLNRIQRETEERQRESLRLRTLDLLNTDESGAVLGGPTTTFESSTVKFVDWRATFDYRLQKSQSTRYRLDSAYKFPTGQSYTVDDCQVISENQKQVTFTGRIGNSKGGAFLPGSYTINFLLNGRPFTQKAFKVVTRMLDPGWYLLVAPAARSTKTLPYRVVSGGAPISEWVSWQRYESQRDCQAAQRRVMRQALMIDKQRTFKLPLLLGPDQREFEVHRIQGIFPICVASDDPCLTGIGTSSSRKDCSLLSYFSQFESNH